MNLDQLEFEAGFEPERYELWESAHPMRAFDRREFFKKTGGGIIVFLVLDAFCGAKDALSQEAGGRRRDGGGNRGGGRGGVPQEIGAWLHIDAEGRVTVYTGKVEVGQNIRTSLSQAVAEELSAPLSSIRMVMGDTELVPFDGGTSGSRTTPDMARQLRRTAAAARELLFDLAAEKLKADRGLLEADGGKIIHRETREAIEFGKLTSGQKLAKAIPENQPAIPAERWKVAGRPAAKVNGRDFVTGRHQYASDMRLEGMLHGKILRPPSLGATLVSADTGPAAAMPGVTVVKDGGFIGVAAPSVAEAERAIEAIRAEWKQEPQISDKELFEHLKKTASSSGGGRGGSAQKTGSIPDGLAAADVRLQATYNIAYIAHVPLEPRAAAARWEDGRLTVWTGTQRPFGVRGDLAGALQVPSENIRVIVPDTGSGYGGKHTGEAAMEAARLARAAGKPVKVAWTRQEEFTWAYARPAGVIEVSSGAKKDGSLTAWEFHNYNSGASSIRSLYESPNQLIEFHPASSPLRQGSYRALASTANTFARESHMDEIASAIGIDPLEFRLKNLKDARLRAVLEAVAKTFGWGAKPEAGRGFGIAGGTDKGSYVATCAEVAVDRASGRVKVVRAASAFECGAIVNPDHLRSQAEGALVMGLGGALFEALRFENGKILNAGFSNYRLPRFSDAPAIEITLLDRKDLPSAGAGETPIIAIAPAVGNAIFQATGLRLRSLPMAPRGLPQ